MTIINEVNRLVIEFGTAVNNHLEQYPLSKESQIWLVCETDSEQPMPRWRALGRIDWSYRHFGNLCDKEVIEVEFQERLVNSATVKAEKYIGLWRESSKKMIAFSALQSTGLLLFGEVSLPAQALQENLEKSPDAKISKLLDGDFITEKTFEVIKWFIPLDSLANCISYLHLANQWFSDETVPKKSSDIKVVTLTGRVPPIVQHETFDLFAI
jgi:hypothetical protein